ncbi:hypothetical protein B0H10DRAFT_2095479 [Mycena sp. CBHHK59/15]|nr:hypothetical protein B0H10DRAFT_2111274 [Mycena sp. CBHHK59/15]KAJ6586229.1 hypothetical protein B0H10DRAFT_2095479 [Mycena sp. CBHHK59/15]
MFIRTGLLLSALSVGSVLGSIALYGQCGGDDIAWADTCAEGLSCVYLNFWYSQCLAATTTDPSGGDATSTASIEARRATR